MGLPADILEEVQRYQDEVFKLFKEFSEDDYTLPLSRRIFKNQNAVTEFPCDGEFQSQYMNQIIEYCVRSPFVALTGVGDHLTWPSELTTTLRSGLHIDSSMFPMLLPPDWKDAKHMDPTNSYLLDLMTHRFSRCLWQDNAVNATVCYANVKKFNDVLDMMNVIFKLDAPPDDIVRQTFEELADEVSNLLKSLKASG